MDMSLRARSTTSKQASISSDASEIPLLPVNNNNNDNNNNNNNNFVSDSPEWQPTPRPSISKRALETTANLANLLPTGTLLAFQLLIPIFTNNGSCDTATRPMTFILLALLAFSCFLACFTDSFKAPDGQIYYGLATFQGLWIFDYQAAKISGMPNELNRYRVGFIDFIHAVLSVLVFVAVALRDKNVVNCFYPTPDHETKQVLDVVPIGIGVICSLLFVVFPTRRHGIGFPVTPDRR
ncbi:protein DMP3-like [Lycium ferocissimum]|uniref:protein DMP3-like n=1 Tax=Lycium ferocissimum TaxID=112874 RepID=UPI00281610DA|nr:protein DMP3-like [Lycium ferocissimum]